jgi:hypothetical protein
MEGNTMNLMKALVPSTILTLLVAALVGVTGSHGAFLKLEGATFGGHAFYWSWPFFLTVMAINCVLVTRMSKDVNA